MIKRSLFIFATALLLHIIIRDVVKPDVEVTQMPWQANQQIGQRYLYSKDTIQNIFTGSSMSFHLDFNGTKESITNIALTGESAQKGIKLVATKGKITGIYPKRIYIEMNTLSNMNPSVFDDIIYNPFLFYPRQYVSALRDGKQPLPWIATLAEKHMTPYIIPHRYEFLEKHIRYETTEEEENEKLKTIINFVPNERFNKTTLSQNQRITIENELTKNLSQLIENGCTPYFVEMPASDKYRYSQEYTTIREIIEKNYPKYAYIHYPSDSNFQTYDGLHLTATDSPRYSAYLRSVMDSITCAEKVK